MNKTKHKIAVYLHPETMEQLEQVYREDGCRSRTEFIEKAVRFYLAYLSASDSQSLLPNTFLSNMKSIVAESDNRVSRLLFKLAVEMAMMVNLLASISDVDDITLARLRGECIKEVKKLNGALSMEEAVKWQRG
jgi:metal-responsive CopG/Arc/MetJ family transcriptional regulator